MLSLNSGCGCLGKGFVTSSDPLIGVTAGSVLNIPAQLLEGNKTYTFKLRLDKAGRNSETVVQTIELLPGDVPSVLIRYLNDCMMKGPFGLGYGVGGGGSDVYMCRFSAKIIHLNNHLKHATSNI